MEMIDFNAKKGFLCDMDGVIYHGNHILPGAAEFIHWLQDTHKEYLFLTNNSGMTPRELHQKLWRMGLDVPEEHFYTSALATAAFLADQAPGCSVYALGEAGLLNALYDRGITMNDVNPDYVVIGEARAYSLDTLTKATNLVLAGAKLIGANSDTCGPTDEGIAPACRALISPIEMATGKNARLPLGRGRHDRRPHGHRRHLRHGERHGHRARAQRRVHARDARRVCLPAERCARRRGGHPAAGAAGVTTPAALALPSPCREGAERSEADAVFPDITHHGNSVSAPLDQCCPIKPSPQRERLSKRTADRRQKGKTEHRPGRKQSRAVLFLSKENTAFKRECARTVSRRRCRASKSFLCVWGKVVNNR